MITTTAALTPITSKLEMELQEGLEFILNHLDNLWPRTASTYVTKGGQRLVNNSAEAMAFFKASFFLDCRISGYPKYTDYYVSNTSIAPSVLLVDIDKEHFKTSEEFELTAARTYSNFQKILGSRPSVLWTGGGYHFLTPQKLHRYLMNKQLKVETNDLYERGRLDGGKKEYSEAQEREREAENKISKLSRRVTELQSVLSKVEGPMDAIWIPTAVMEDLREIAIKKKESVNDIAREMIWYSMADEWSREREEEKEKKEKELATP